MSEFRAPEETEQLFRAFEEIGPVIEEFAKKNNLYLDKYYHGFASWDLRYRRKIGGSVNIEVIFDEDTRSTFFVHATWAFNDFDKFKRHIRRMKPPIEFKRGDAPRL